MPRAESAPIHESAITALAPLPPRLRNAHARLEPPRPKIVRLLDSSPSRAPAGHRQRAPDPIGRSSRTCSIWRGFRTCDLNDRAELGSCRSVASST